MIKYLRLPPKKPKNNDDDLMAVNSKLLLWRKENLTRENILACVCVNDVHII